MAEILWHRRETRRQTDNTNIGLRYRATSRLYAELAAIFGECPEIPIGSRASLVFGRSPLCANQLRQYEEPPVVAKRGLEGDPHTTYNTQEEDYGKRSVCWHGRR